MLLQFNFDIIHLIFARARLRLEQLHRKLPLVPDFYESLIGLTSIKEHADTNANNRNFLNRDNLQY